MAAAAMACPPMMRKALRQIDAFTCYYPEIRFVCPTMRRHWHGPATHLRQKNADRAPRIRGEMMSQLVRSGHGEPLFARKNERIVHAKSSPREAACLPGRPRRCSDSRAHRNTAWPSAPIIWRGVHTTQIKSRESRWPVSVNEAIATNALLRLVL